MAGFKLEGFQGLAPRYSERLLPPMAATIARNTKLLNGEIRGFRQLFPEQDLSGLASTVRRVLRVPDTPDDAFIAFDSRDVSIVKSPLINDAFDRYFWAGDGAPKMNTGDRIKNGDDPFLLGIPTPLNAPVVTPPVGTEETRAYVYTFVSEFGEESAPSPPTIETGSDTGTWNLSGIDATMSNLSQRAIDDGTNFPNSKVNIYRTVPGNASSSFFFVDEIPFTQTTYADNETNEDVVVNPLLESTSFAEPPDDLEGFVVMPNGYLIGWVGTRLVFSVPYRPHAWPVEFELGTEFPIVAIGVFGATAVIGTESQPYYGQGVSPVSFTHQKVDEILPCLSRRGLVSTRAGVYYPSIEGLVGATGAGPNIITRDILTKEEWARFRPNDLYASNLGLQYIAFSDSNSGFIYDPQEPTKKLIELEGITNVEGIETDPYTGNVYLLRDDTYTEWDPEVLDPGIFPDRLPWQWKGKLLQAPKPLNFGAAKIQFDVGSAQNPYSTVEVLIPYNQELFALAPNLNTLNGHALGGSPAQSSGLVAMVPQAEIRQPLGGSLLYNINNLLQIPFSVRFIVYIRDKGRFNRKIVDTVVTEEKVLRLPTGFKTDLYQFELCGNTTVYSLQVAETPKQLAGV